MDKYLSELNIKQISLGNNHACVIDSDGAVFSWGLGSEGQLGLGHAESRKEPENVTASLSTLHTKATSCGDYHTCKTIGCVTNTHSSSYAPPQLKLTLLGFTTLFLQYIS
jgi:hypothetical protein